MGVHYMVLPLDQPCCDWLSSQKLQHPKPQATNRYPTPAELTEALEKLPGCRAKINKSLERGYWDANVEWAEDRLARPGNTVCLLKYHADDMPSDFYIEKGPMELAVQIAINLAARCGPFVVVDDSTCIPIEATADSDLVALMRDWRERVAKL
jgi:hypothetical protein